MENNVSTKSPSDLFLMLLMPDVSVSFQTRSSGYTMTLKPAANATGIGAMLADSSITLDVLAIGSLLGILATVALARILTRGRR